MKKLSGMSMIIFCETRANAHRVSLMLNYLDFPAVLLHGKMTQVSNSQIHHLPINEPFWDNGSGPSSQISCMRCLLTVLRI